MALHFFATDGTGQAEAQHFATRLANFSVMPNVVLPTGNSPKPFYASFRNIGSIPQFRYFQLDGYKDVAPCDPRSYAKEVDDEVLRPLKIRDAMHVTFNTCSDFPEAECEFMEQKIIQHGGLQMVWMGAGPNGHGGFHEPGTPLDTRSHISKLSESTRRANAPVCAPLPVPTHALTMGMGTLMDAEEINLVAGENKTSILVKAFTGPVTSDVPISALQKHGRVNLFAPRSVMKALEAG